MKSKSVLGSLPENNPLPAESVEMLGIMPETAAPSSVITEKLTYLAKKMNAEDFEALISHALTLLNTGLSLEEKGYELHAVKKGIFAKEVIKIKISRG